MSGTDAYPLPPGSGRVLMMSTFALAAAAALALALGIDDARLLRLALVAALWAALLGAFAAARMRRESSSCAAQADQLRTVYQLELEREVTARREHTRTVEHELREQAELSQRREIVELRAELAAMRASLEQLLDRDPRVERVTLRAPSTRLLPLPSGLEDGCNQGPRMTAAAGSLAGPEFQFGPGSPPTPALVSTPSSASSADTGHSHGNGQGRHGAPTNGFHHNGHNGFDHNGFDHNGFDHNGFEHNGDRSLWAPEQAASVSSVAQPQRTVSDLLAAYGAASAPRRRRSRQDGPAT